MKILWLTDDYIPFRTLPLWIQISMLVIILVSVISLVYFIKKPFDIKNGEEFVKAYNKAANIKVKKPVSRFMWYFPFKPISKEGNQILPYTLMKFKRYLFLIDAMFWSEATKWKQNNNKFMLWFMAIIRAIIFFAAIVALDVWIGWFIGIKEFQRVDFLGATFYLLAWAFGLSIIPAVYISIAGVETLYKMDISKKDRDELIKRIKLLWLFPLAMSLFEIIRFFAQIVHYFIPKKK